MARYSTPPPVLQQAIDQAAQRYKVPPSDLVGIWRWESGSTYPNPARNPQGYGGLFGTTDAFGPPQEQANLAASILATGYKRAGGDQVGALSYYNTGRTDAASGRLYAQKVLAVSGPTARGSTTYGIAGGVPSLTQGLPRPGAAAQGPGGGGGSFWGSVWGAVSGVPGDVGGAASSAWDSVEGGAESLIKGPLDFLKAALWLLNPLTWLRAVEGLFGFVLLLGGFLVAVGAADKLGTVLPGPAGAAASGAAGLAEAGAAAA